MTFNFNVFKMNESNDIPLSEKNSSAGAQASRPIRRVQVAVAKIVSGPLEDSVDRRCIYIDFVLSSANVTGFHNSTVGLIVAEIDCFAKGSTASVVCYEGSLHLLHIRISIESENAILGLVESTIGLKFEAGTGSGEGVGQGCGIQILLR